MRRLFAVLLGWMLCSAALAAEPKPEVIEEVDLLRAQLAEAQANEARTRADALELLAQQARAALRARYHIADGDSIDPQTRVIKRGSKTPQAGSAVPAPPVSAARRK